MAGEGIRVPIDGDISPLLDQFSKLPGRTQAEMDAVGRVIDDEINRGRIAKAFADLPGISQKQSRKAANMLAREMDRAARESERSLQDIKRGFGALAGGVVNDLEDIGGAIGALGPMAGTAAAGIGLVAAAGVALYAATAQTGVLADENARLSREIDELVYSVGTLMPSAFESGTSALADLVEGAKPAVTGLRELINVGSELTDEFSTQAAITIGILTAALSGNADEARRWADIYNSSRGYVGAIEAGTEATIEAEKQLRIAQYNRTQFQGPMLKQEAAATVAKKAHAVATKEQASALELEIAALQTRDQWMERAVEIDNREAEALADLDKQIAANAKSITEAQTTQTDGAEKAAQAAVDLREGWLAAGSATADSFGVIGEAVGRFAAEGSAAAGVAVAIQKAAGIASIGVSTAVASMRALAELGPIAGPIAAGAMIAAGVAQAAVVAATPESFHVGGIVRGGGMAPDEVLTKARPGEGYLTGQGVRSVGGATGIAALNRGEGSGGPIRVEYRYQHKQFNDFVADNLRSRNSPLRKALRGRNG